MRAIYPIVDLASYNQALSEVEELMDRNPEPEGEDAVWLETMATLIEAYEDKEFPLDVDYTALDYLKFVMSERGLVAKDLVPAIGQLNRVYEVLNGKRELTLPMIRRLSKNFRMSAERLVGG